MLPESIGSRVKEEALIIKGLAVGPIMANCYIVGCENTREAVVIDPGEDVDRILATLEQEDLSIKCILNTHGHFDHVGGNRQLKAATGAQLLIHQSDASMLGMISATASSFRMALEDSPPPDAYLEDGMAIAFGTISLQVISTPGHSPGGVSFYSDGVVFVGDTLFAGSIGRTDFPGGSFETLRQSIQERLFPLGDDVTVYTGHGPPTTIGQEKRFNPFVALR